MKDRVRVAAGRVAAANRWGTPTMAEALAELAEARIEKQITAAAPLLSTEARRRLADLLELL